MKYTMPTRYEYWQHKASRELYAVRWEQRRVTGMAGPFPPETPRNRAALPGYAYDDAEERIAWLLAHEGEFLLVGKDR